MASNKKGKHVSVVEWAKHLRKGGKKDYWDKERAGTKKFIKKFRDTEE